MDDKLLEALASQAGLDIMLASFRDDLVAAASQVEAQRNALADPLAPTDEPWPPMPFGTPS